MFHFQSDGIKYGRLKTRREVAYYAKELNVTSKYLSDTIKRVTGQSISSHINNAAVSIIIENMKGNRLSMIQIVDEMNFIYVSYFSCYCTKHIAYWYVTLFFLFFFCFCKCFITRCYEDYSPFFLAFSRDF